MKERTTQESEHSKVQKVRDVSAALLNGAFDPLADDRSAAPEDDVPTADQFAVHLIWTGRDAMLPERPYLIRLAGIETTVQITDLSYRVEPDTLEQLAAKTLVEGEIAYCKIALDRAVPFAEGNSDDWAGGFALVDKAQKLTVGAGVIDFSLRRATNVVWYDMEVDKAARARTNQQTPCVLWFTGLSGAGKSTIANRAEQKLHAMGKRTYLLDGDNIRHGLSRDLGFTDQDRVENIRRVAEVAKLMADAGLIVMASFISPFRSERVMARSLMSEGEFVEIFVDASLAVCEARDPKLLYKKARAGQLKNFTGIDSAYEPPQNAEIVLNAEDTDPDTLAEQIISYLQTHNYL